MPGRNIDWKSNSQGPYARVHLVYARARVRIRIRPILARAIAHAGGLLVDAHAGGGWCAGVLQARAHRPWQAGGAGAGSAIPGPRAPAENETGPTWVPSMHTRNRPAAQASG